MTAAYSLVKPYPSTANSTETLPPAYAVVADDTTAHYVFPEGKEFKGLDDARIERISSISKIPPSGTDGWLKIALSNIGYFYGDTPVSTDNIVDAIKQAKDALKS